MEVLYGRAIKAVEKTIEACVSRGILKVFLEDERKEVIDIMSRLFNQEDILRGHDATVRREAQEKQEQETKVLDIKNLMENLKFTVEQAMDALSIPKEKRAIYAGLVAKNNEAYTNNLHM